MGWGEVRSERIWDIVIGFEGVFSIQNLNKSQFWLRVH